MHIYKTEYFGLIERIEEIMNRRYGEGKWTQKMISEGADISENTISKWFSNKGNRTMPKIRKSNLQLIANYLDCDVEYLECKQNYPWKKEKGKKFKVKTPVSLSEKYLNKLEELMKTTTYRFSYRIAWESVGGEVYTGTFIDGDTKYYYENIETEYGEMYYEISVNGSEYKKKTPEEMDDFVKGILKYIAYELSQL